MTDGFILLLWAIGFAGTAAAVLTIELDAKLKRTWLVRIPVAIVIWLSVTLVLALIVGKALVWLWMHRYYQHG